MTWGYDAIFSNIEKDNDLIGYQTFLSYYVQNRWPSKFAIIVG